jgi:hypothetical protein
MSNNSERNAPKHANERSNSRSPKGSVKKAPAKGGHLFKRWSAADKKVGHNDMTRTDIANNRINDQGGSNSPRH